MRKRHIDVPLALRLRTLRQGLCYSETHAADIILPVEMGMSTIQRSAMPSAE
jgi:hypothetical protein